MALLLRSSPRVRAAALHLSAVYEMTYQQALGGLVILAEFDSLTPLELGSVLGAAFGCPRLREIESVHGSVGILLDHGLLLPERHGALEFDFTEEDDE